MKTITLLILSVVSVNASGQIKKVNELLNRYSFSGVDRGDRKPVNNSAELAVSHIFQDTASGEYHWTETVMKWKDLDTVKFSETSRDEFYILLYGKAMTYIECKEPDTCHTVYNGRYYKVFSPEDSIFLSIRKKTRREFVYSKKDSSYILIYKKLPKKYIFSKSVRKEFREAFQQVNNAVVIEEYLPDPLPRITFDKMMNELIIDFAGEYAKTVTSEVLRKVKHVQLCYLCCPSYKFEVVSFTFYISGPSKPVSIVENHGNFLNDEIMNLIANARPGDALTFDNVKVSGPDGTRTVEGFTIGIK